MSELPMDDERLRAHYQRALARRAPGTRKGCPAPEALAAAVEREGSEEARLATLDHAMACAHCARELELLRATRLAARPRSPARAPLLAAASLLLAAGIGAGLWSRAGGVPGEAGPDVLRGEAAAVVGVSPVGAVAPGTRPTFVWRPVPGATGYVVEVLDGAGDAVWTGRTTDTLAVLADSARLAPGDYAWWVRAELPNEEERRSDPRRFTVPAP